MSTQKFRRTAGRFETSSMWQVVMSLALLVGYSTYDDPGIGNGTTAGFLRTNAAVRQNVEGVAGTKISTDDLWDLSAETDTTAAQYRAYWLLLDIAGNASIAAGANAATAADALQALPDLDGTKSVIGVFVADPSCDFDDAGGLAAQGTIYDGIPAGVPLKGLAGHTYIKPPVIELTGF